MLDRDFAINTKKDDNDIKYFRYKTLLQKKEKPSFYKMWNALKIKANKIFFFCFASLPVFANIVYMYSFLAGGSSYLFLSGLNTKLHILLAKKKKEEKTILKSCFRRCQMKKTLSKWRTDVLLLC